MSGYYAPSGATATGSLNSTAITITGGDVNPILPGMLIYFGSRTIADGPGYLVSAVTRTDASNGAITLASGLLAAQTSQPFFVDLAQAGNASTYGNLSIARILNALAEFFGQGTTVDATTKQLVFNKATAGALSRILWEIAGADQFRVEQRTVSGVEHLAIMSTNDGGTNWVDAMLVRRTDGRVTFAVAPVFPLIFASAIRAAAGAAATPSITFDGDPDTGLYSVSANVLGFATDGAVRAVLNASGNLGIGTTSPTARLHTVATADGAILINAGPNSLYRIFSNASGLSLEATNPGQTAYMPFTFQGSVVQVGPSGTPLRPLFNNVSTCGQPSLRWSFVYATTGDFSATVKHGVYTVATLPAAATVGAGSRAAVTDANATTFNSVVAGGGANFVPVISDGTNWRIG